MSKLSELNVILKSLSNEELDKLDMLVWSEINSRDPEYFEDLESGYNLNIGDHEDDNEDTEC